MAESKITDYCVYTIVDGKKLARLAEKGISDQFEEGKPWTTASKLWLKARSTAKGMPVLFADAADCSRLLYWGFLTDVQIIHGATRYSVDRIRKLRGKHTPQELVLRSSGKKIAPDFIRPYAICETPSFLDFV